MKAPADETAQGMAQAVDGAESLLERQSAFESAQHHLSPRVATGPDLDRELDVRSPRSNPSSAIASAIGLNRTLQ
jgi:hypothetical protein